MYKFYMKFLMSESLNVILLDLICNANISNTRLTKADLHGELEAVT